MKSSIINFLYFRLIEFFTMEAEKFEKMRRIIFQTNFNRTAAVLLYQETYPDDIPAPSRQSFRRYNRLLISWLK
jgi:hypothetical protein